MDSDTLNTASTYLNNLLLARGLLRNGKGLDFAKPTRDTRAQIINLVHDLLLRRDRDQEHREQIALTLRTLRTDQTRKDAELEKLQTRLGEKERSVVQAQTETRAIKLEMKRMETTVKTLQDQLAKLKASVSHIKMQCTNDIRKRDMHIERLKTHLQGQQRGNKRGVVAPTINISGGNAASGRSAQSFDMSVRDLGDPEYSLHQETNEFLTQLGQSLSDENDGLIAMLRGTIQTIQDLLGLPTNSQHVNSTSADINGEADTSFTDAEAPISYDALATEVESTLDVLRTVLTSADFVSMAEVEQRDEEIVRLREGWEMMEARWKEVLLMMNIWRTNMENGNDTINLEDLKRGLGLGEGLGEGIDLSPTRPSKHDDDKHLKRGQAYTADDSEMVGNGDSGIGHGIARLQPENKMKPSSMVLNPPELFHQMSVKERHLRKISPNVQSPRKVVFTEETAKSSPALYKDGTPNNTAFKEQTPTSDRPSSERVTRSQRSVQNSSSPDRKTRLSSQRSHIDLFSEPDMDLVDQESPLDQLTVEEKLRVVQLEAEQAAAAAAAAIQVGDMQRAESSQLDLEIEEEISRVRSPAKKSRIKGRPRRRKSTLSPEELENLMLGGMGSE